MADSTINELVNLDSVANNDELVLWDTSASGTKKATVSNVVTPVATSVATSAINALDVASVGGSGKYISAISETNGKISATATSFGSVASGNAYPVTGGAVNTAIMNNTAVNYLGVCDTEADTAAKVVTCAGWNGLPGQSILITFTNENTASNPTLNINSKGALPIYNGSTREEYIPEGNMLLIVNADATKLQVVYAPTTDVVESGNSRPVSSKGVNTRLSNYAKISKFTLGTQKTYSFGMEYLHTYIITLGHPMLQNKNGRYLIMIQNESQHSIVNMSNENNYTLSINDKILTITTTTDYGLGYIEDLGEHV